MAGANEISSFIILVDEIKKTDMNSSWMLALNFMMLLKIMLCIMPTSASAEQEFSALHRIKTDSRNAIGDKRMHYLVMLTSHPDKLDEVDIIKVANKFA